AVSERQAGGRVRPVFYQHGVVSGGAGHHGGLQSHRPVGRQPGRKGLLPAAPGAGISAQRGASARHPPAFSRGRALSHQQAAEDVFYTGPLCVRVEIARRLVAPTGAGAGVSPGPVPGGRRPAVSVLCGTGRPSVVSGPCGSGPPAGTGRPSVAGVQYGTGPPPATARRRPGGAAAGRRPGGSGRRERWCDAPLGKRRKTKANPNPQPKLKPKPEPKPALKLNPKPKPKPGPKPPAPAALVKRRNRAVFRVADPSRRRIVVVKRYDDWRDAVSERDVMRSYGKARHLVRMYRWRKRDGRGYIIMEYVRGSTLNEVIARRGALPPAKVRALALSVLDGLHQLHRRGFVHGDLHGRNVIVTDYDKAKVKIIDLQHAVKLGPSGRGRAKRIVPEPPPWLPPESRDGWLTPGYDIYGVG